MARTVGDQAAAEAEQALAALAEGHCPIHHVRLTDTNPVHGGLCQSCHAWWWGDGYVGVTIHNSRGCYGHSWSVEQVRDMIAPRLILADTVSQIRASAAR